MGEGLGQVGIAKEGSGIRGWVILMDRGSGRNPLEGCSKCEGSSEGKAGAHHNKI